MWHRGVRWAWPLAVSALALGGCRSGHLVDQIVTSAVVDAVTSRPREPQGLSATAVFDPGRFTTTYTVNVGLGQDADVESETMSARWEGPNCGESGVIVERNKFQRGVMVQEGGAFTQDPALFSWTHPHPPCTADATHGDVTVKVTITNPSGSLVCSFKTAATSNGTCVDPPRAPIGGSR